MFHHESRTALFQESSTSFLNASYSILLAKDPAASTLELQLLLLGMFHSSIAVAAAFCSLCLLKFMVDELLQSMVICSNFDMRLIRGCSIDLNLFCARCLFLIFEVLFALFCQNFVCCILLTGMVAA